MFNVNDLPYSASMQISQRANELKASGKSIINLGIGDTHFPLPIGLQSKLTQAAANNKTHYSSAQGILELRQSISDRYKNSYSPNEIVVSHGVKNGMHTYLAASDIQNICVLEPAWLGYESLAQLTNKTFHAVNLFAEDWMDQLVNTEFDALIICCPNNPTGQVFNNETIQRLSVICSAKNAQILIDEIYEHYIFEGDNTWKELYGLENVVVFNGFSKSHAATGLRIGYMCLKNADLIDRIIRIQQHSITCPSTLAQYAFSEFKAVDQEVQAIKDYYDINRKEVLNIFPEFGPYEPDGGFYFFVDLAPYGITNAQEFCLNLLNEKGVSLVHGAAYGKGFDTWVRISYSVDREELIEGLKRIKSYLNK